MLQRVYVIGGGVIGCATALALAMTAACRVSLIERSTLGSESSWAGAGLLSPLLPWHYPGEVTRLVDWSNELYPAWVAALQAASGIDPEYRSCGMLVLPPYDRAAARAWAASSGGAVHESPARSVLPDLALDAEGLWLPQVAQVRNPRLLQALRQALTQRGVEILEHTEVRGWVRCGNQVSGVETSRGRFEADTYLVAAGAWSAKILDEPLPIKPMRGQIVLLKGPAGDLRHILYADGLYVIPRDDGHILIGSTLEDVGFDKSTTEAARVDLLARASALLPLLADLPVVGHWAGLRPGSPDNIPIMARHPALDNLYLSSGHYRYGVTMAPASAQFMANLILGRPNPIDAEPYRWPI